METFVPKGQRPPGVFPAHPRVIYKTKRKNLSHEGRIGRIDRQETLDVFRAFSEGFHAHLPRLDPELGGYLHNHGFMPDKGALYGLPNEALDSYLSDFQAMILPLANGLNLPATANRLLSWPLMRRVLPLAPRAGAWQRGRLQQITEGGDPTPGETLLARPAETAQGPVPAPNQNQDKHLAWHDRLPAPPDAARNSHAADRLFLRLPAGSDQAEVIRIALLCDPQGNRPTVLSAALLEAGSGFATTSGAPVTCRRIDPETGLAGPALRFLRDTIAAPETVDPRGRALPGWWPAVVSGLLLLPVWAVLQADVIEVDGQPLIIDLTDRLDAAALQVHGPIMGGETAVRFIREYGV